MFLRRKWKAYKLLNCSRLLTCWLQDQYQQSSLQPIIWFLHALLSILILYSVLLYEMHILCLVCIPIYSYVIWYFETNVKRRVVFPVCQEAIWEAFRIFLDRVPNSEEYRAWVYTCQHENLCMDDLAQNFSSSQEHLEMVARVSAALTHYGRTFLLHVCFLINLQCKCVIADKYPAPYFQRVAEQTESEG